MKKTFILILFIFNWHVLRTRADELTIYAIILKFNNALSRSSEEYRINFNDKTLNYFYKQYGPTNPFEERKTIKLSNRKMKKLLIDLYKADIKYLYSISDSININQVDGATISLKILQPDIEPSNYYFSFSQAPIEIKEFYRKLKRKF